MPYRINSRSLIRRAIARNQRDLVQMHDRIVEIMHIYVDSHNDYHAAYIGQLIPGIDALKEAHDKAYNVV